LIPPDVEKWVRACEQGRLYQSLAKPKETDKQVKRRVLVALYSRNKPKNPRFRNEMKARLKARFPSMAEMLTDLKRREHSRAAHLMQNWEATIFIYRICHRIMEKRPDTVIFTIHDSLLTTPDSVKYVKGVIQEEFANLGVCPSLKEERYERS
jgi:hypothetical protein